jgi:hypothetical protein
MICIMQIEIVKRTNDSRFFTKSSGRSAPAVRYAPLPPAFRRPNPKLLPEQNPIERTQALAFVIATAKSMSALSRIVLFARGLAVKRNANPVREQTAPEIQNAF